MGFIVIQAKAKTLNEFFGVLPILSDKFLVWGESARNYALECGIPNEKIHIVGNPLLMIYLKIRKQISQTITYCWPHNRLQITPLTILL